MHNERHAAQLLGGEYRDGRVRAPGPGHSRADRSMWVVFDRQAPDGFVVGSFAGDPFDACRDHVRRAIGLPTWEPNRKARKDGERDERVVASESDRLGDKRARDMRAIALEIFGEARTGLHDAARTYLSRRVGHDFDCPADIRSHPRCPRKIDGKLEHHPALVILLRDIHTDEARAIQRIFLKPDGSDRLHDEKGKATLGPAAGAVVKLIPDAEVSSGLGLTEGVEKGLAILSHGWAPIWATCGTSGLASFPVLAGIDTLTIFADNDHERRIGNRLLRAGQEAAQKCARRWNDAGRGVAVRIPIDVGTDWSDALAGA